MIRLGQRTVLYHEGANAPHSVLFMFFFFTSIKVRAFRKGFYLVGGGGNDHRSNKENDFYCHSWGVSALSIIIFARVVVVAFFFFFFFKPFLFLLLVLGFGIRFPFLSLRDEYVRCWVVKISQEPVL